jgi:hypothetical protein
MERGGVEAGDRALDHAESAVAGRDDAAAQVVAVAVGHDLDALVQAVDDAYLFWEKIRDEKLLVKNGGGVRIQFVHDAGIRLKILKGNAVLGDQGVVLVKKDKGRAADQLMEFQVVIFKGVLHELFVMGAHE